MTTPSLRALPSVEKLLGLPPLAAASRELPRALVAGAVRATLAEARAVLKRKRNGSAPDPGALVEQAAERARAEAAPAVRRVLNATGVVLHTNLGRAPLAPAAREAVTRVAAGYSSLEYDLAAGRRDERGLGCERWQG
jgi:L-seryl-tRNA(Ser) seleniumtransferase